jgi:hypothetical protein
MYSYYLEKAKKAIRDYCEKDRRRRQSGFFDLPPEAICTNPHHNPPSYIHIPYGKGYRHVCPGCGKVTEIYGNIVNF